MLNDKELYHDWVNRTRARTKRSDRQTSASCTRDCEIPCRDVLCIGCRLALRCRSSKIEIAGELLCTGVSAVLRPLGVYANREPLSPDIGPNPGRDILGGCVWLFDLRLLDLPSAFQPKLARRQLKVAQGNAHINARQIGTSEEPSDRSSSIPPASLQVEVPTRLAAGHVSDDPPRLAVAGRWPKADHFKRYGILACGLT